MTLPRAACLICGKVIVWRDRDQTRIPLEARGPRCYDHRGAPAANDKTQPYAPCPKPSCGHQWLHHVDGYCTVPRPCDDDPPTTRMVAVMRSRPILFSGPMVLALLANRKTQTRRIARPHRDGNPQPCPYGVPGDELWVRETWMIGTETRHGGANEFHYCADGHRVHAQKLTLEQCDWMADIWTSDPASSLPPGEYHDDKLRWHSSIHMPRWASRITLTITNTRLQALHDITETDAVAEGTCVRHGEPSAWDDIHRHGGARACFLEAWQRINGYSEENPLVWVIEFTVNPQRRHT